MDQGLCNLKGILTWQIEFYKWPNMQKESLGKGYYNTCYSKLKFELNSNKSKVFELWCIDDVDIKYTIRVILCKKNHVKRNTTTQVIAGSILNWIWIWTDQRTCEFLCAHAIDRKYMEWVIQRNKNHSIWINGWKDTVTGSLNLNLNKFKFKSLLKLKIFVPCWSTEQRECVEKSFTVFRLTVGEISSSRERGVFCKRGTSLQIYFPEKQSGPCTCLT